MHCCCCHQLTVNFKFLSNLFAVYILKIYYCCNNYRHCWTLPPLHHRRLLWKLLSLLHSNSPVQMLALAGNKVRLIFPLLVYEFIFYFYRFMLTRKKTPKEMGSLSLITFSCLHISLSTFIASFSILDPWIFYWFTLWSLNLFYSTLKLCPIWFFQIFEHVWKYNYTFHSEMYQNNIFFIF